MRWPQMMPRLIHDARALLRKPARTAQLLEQRFRSGVDPEVKGQLDSLIESHRQLDRFLTRVGLLADSMDSDGHHTLPLSAVVQAVWVASKAELNRIGAMWEVGSLAKCDVPERFQQVLQEFVDNSIRFKSPARTLCVAVECALADDSIELRYQDNAEGWDPEYTEKVFQPFERLDVERGGFGLGLSIARAIVENAGGTLTATSAPDGSSFVIRIPAN